MSDRDQFDTFLENSSLGTEGAKRLRNRTPVQLRKYIRQRGDEIRKLGEKRDLSRFSPMQPSPPVWRRYGKKWPLGLSLTWLMAAIAFAAALVRTLGWLAFVGGAIAVCSVWLAYRALRKDRERQAAAEQVAEQARLVAAEQARLAEVEHALVKRLQESERLKDDLLAAMSHELRTPLAGMLGALATLSAREGQLTGAQRRELVDMAARQGDRLKRLIEQLLLAGRLEQAAGKRVDLPPVDVSALAGQAAATAKVIHPDRVIVLDLGTVLPVKAAPEAVLQVLDNLLDNAAKYSPPNTPIRMEATYKGQRAVLAVEDAGPGIPTAERERIFDRFTQLDSWTTRRSGGVGLGLYIARQLARAQGGELLVEEPTRAASGSRFELHLPLTREGRPIPDESSSISYDRPA